MTTKREDWPAEMTAAEYLARVKGTTKYGAQRTEAHGRTFASKAEARRYGELLLLETAGQIAGLECQPRYDLPGGVRYIGDFAYTEGGRRVCEDVKGVLTPVFRIKAKLMAEAHPDVELRIVQ